MQVYFRAAAQRRLDVLCVPGACGAHVMCLQLTQACLAGPPPPWLGGGQHTSATTASHEAPASVDAEVNSPLGDFAWRDEGDGDSGDDSEEGRRYADELRRADGFASADEDEEDDGDADDDGDDPQRHWDLLT